MLEFVSSVLLFSYSSSETNPVIDKTLFMSKEGIKISSSNSTGVKDDGAWLIYAWSSEGI